MKNSLDSAIAFGAVLKKWRLSRNLSQHELAKTCKLNRTFISLLERGERQPTLTTIFAVAEALKCPSHELIRQTERYQKRQSVRQTTRPSQRL